MEQDFPLIWTFTLATVGCLSMSRSVTGTCFCTCRFGTSSCFSMPVFIYGESHCPLDGAVGFAVLEDEEALRASLP